MGQILHGCARTTEAIRRAIQHSQESLRVLARRHGVNPKTIAKWRKRCSVADLRAGPKQAGSTVLSPEEEAVVVAFRQHTSIGTCIHSGGERRYAGLFYKRAPVVPSFVLSGIMYSRCRRITDFPSQTPCPDRWWSFAFQTTVRMR